MPLLVVSSILSFAFSWPICNGDLIISNFKLDVNPKTKLGV